MATDSAEFPVFISYSRKDYYFAESLALHLLKEGVPAWLDVKNLNPGVFWERDLFAALDATACVVIVASADSMKSPNVRQEMERAIGQHKRIIIARFRGARLAAELPNCEVVDFRGAFGPALRKLIQRVQAQPSTAVAAKPLFPKVPVWVAAIVFFLSVPTFAYFVLADWSGGPSSTLLALPILLVVALGLCWLASFSFVQRKMGMTRLASTLAIFGAIFALPLVRYYLGGEAGLKSEAPGFAQAAIHHGGALALVAALPFIALGLIVLFRPYDLLRWTPTGKAWRWYRQQCTARVLGSSGEVPAAQPDDFFTLFDPIDTATAERVRQGLIQFGWRETTNTSGGKTVLLLTNRTGTDWLLQQQPKLAHEVLTIVATTICLPAQLKWLWKREWIDLRAWKIRRLQCKEALPQVPEAVTMPRFPAPVKFANHLLCALGALAFVLLYISNPSLGQSQNNNASPTGNLALIVGFSVVVLCLEMARRLLRRTVTEAVFFRGAWIGWVGTLVLLGCAWYQGIPAPAWLRIPPAVLLLILFPIAMMRTHRELVFWFPSVAIKSSRKLTTLAGNRNWRTFWCTFGYAMLWWWICGMTK